MYESLHYSNTNYFIKKIYELTDSYPQDFIVQKASIDAKLIKSKENEINKIKPRILKVYRLHFRVFNYNYFIKYIDCSRIHTNDFP
jgi:hypothetical protein